MAYVSPHLRRGACRGRIGRRRRVGVGRRKPAGANPQRAFAIA
jgi:hypothetical protein